MQHKHREAVCQQWRSIIAREAHDLFSLEQIASRVSHDPDVRADDMIQRMIDSEIDSRREELRLTERGRDGVANIDHLRNRPITMPLPEIKPTADQIRTTLVSLAHTLHDHIHHKNEPEARLTLQQIRKQATLNPGFIAEDDFKIYEEAIEKLALRLQHLSAQIDALVQSAVLASKDGDEQTVAQLTRRLSSIHATYPRLLDDARLEEIRAAIVEASDEHEHQVAARRLIERERAVAAELRQLAILVRRFHQIARTVAHDSESYKRAEKEYLKAVKEVRSHDAEWLAGFTIELADLLAEWGHPPLDAVSKVDHFLESVSSVLDQIRGEIEEIEHEPGPEPAAN